MAKHSIFISYRRSDSSDVTGRIFDRLTAIFDEEAVFKDVDSIPIGVDFREHLEQAVSQCEIVLAIIGQDWLWAKDAEGNRRLEAPEDYVHIELEAALRRNIPIVPVLVRGATMPTHSDLPLSLQALAYRNATLVRSDPDFNPDVTRLIEGIQKHFDANQVSPIVSQIDLKASNLQPQTHETVDPETQPIHNERFPSNPENAIDAPKSSKKSFLVIGSGIAAILGITGIFFASQTPQTATNTDSQIADTFNPSKDPAQPKDPDNSIGGGSVTNPTPKPNLMDRYSDTSAPDPDASESDPVATDLDPGTEADPVPEFEPVAGDLDPELTSSAIISGEGSKNIRSGPGTDFDEVHLAYPGDRVEILEESSDNSGYIWYKVYFPDSGAEGWIAAQLLDFE